MEEEPITYCAYYDVDTEEIVDFFPADINPDLRNTVISTWKQEIPRKILKTVSEDDLTMQDLRKKIGHSNSTLHENVKKLEELGLIHTKIIYEGNKIRLLAPRILFVTKNPKFRTNIQRFFQGLWVNKQSNEQVIEFLQANPKEFYTTEQIAAKTGIPVDEVEVVLSNWNSQVTRALSDFMKKKPFEKKVLYRAIK